MAKWQLIEKCLLSVEQRGRELQTHTSHLTCSSNHCFTSYLLSGNVKHSNEEKGESESYYSYRFT